VFDAATLAVFLLAAVALILSPGPDTVYVLARGAGDGRRAGVYSALGVATGVLIHTVAAAVGLAALFRAVPAARTVVVLAGAVYLSYLGVRTLGGSTADAEARGTDGNPYLQGLTVNVLNPQVALFFLAFLPGFAPASHPAVGMSLLGVLYAAITAVYLGSVGALSGHLGGRGRRTRLLSGLVLLGIAAYLVLTTV
jgi:threonine/homoserine/homoserine lactone efflux protein